MDSDFFGSDDASDDDFGPELGHTESISCPYCGQSSELAVDLVGGSRQEYIQDCEVCCRPWLVRVRLDAEGYASVSVTTLDDE